MIVSYSIYDVYSENEKYLRADFMKEEDAREYLEHLRDSLQNRDYGFELCKRTEDGYEIEFETLAVVPIRQDDGPMTHSDARAAMFSGHPVKTGGIVYRRIMSVTETITHSHGYGVYAAMVSEDYCSFSCRVEGVELATHEEYEQYKKRSTERAAEWNKFLEEHNKEAV